MRALMEREKAEGGSAAKSAARQSPSEYNHDRMLFDLLIVASPRVRGEFGSCLC